MYQATVYCPLGKVRADTGNVPASYVSAELKKLRYAERQLQRNPER